MQNMDRLSVRGKVLAATAGAFLVLSITSPAKADNSVRWRTIVGIVQAGNTVGNISRRRAAMDGTWRSCQGRSGRQPSEF
jgi:hypothetical protein